LRIDVVATGLFALGSEGDPECFGKASHPQFGHQVRAVNLDRTWADPEIVGDRLVRKTLRQSVENITLPLS